MLPTQEAADDGIAIGEKTENEITKQPWDDPAAVVFMLTVGGCFTVRKFWGFY